MVLIWMRPDIVAGNGFYYLMGNLLPDCILQYFLMRVILLDRQRFYLLHSALYDHRQCHRPGVIGFAEMDAMMYKIEARSLSDQYQ